MASGEFMTYPERLQTFEGYWKNHEATARQLAAIGHVNDRPPVEAFEEGSRCICCSAFVKRHLSVRALEGSGNDTGSYEDGFESFDFHHPSCTRLQVRIPLDPQAIIPGLHGNRMNDLRRKFERDSSRGASVTTTTQRVLQKSSFFTLPPEIRLEIYAMVLPILESVTEILQLNRDSARVITSQGYHKTRPRNTSKLNILRTCRALYDESMDFIYCNTTFRFESTKVLYLFLRSIGKAGRQLIESIDIRCGSREDALAFALLAVCEKLQSICIRLPRPRIFLSRGPIWMVDGMTCLMALSGMKEVTFDSGPDNPPPHYLTDDNPDATIMRKSLTRPRGVPLDTKIFESCTGFEISAQFKMPFAT